MKRRIATSLIAFVTMMPVFAGGADIAIQPRLEGAYNSISNNFEKDSEFGLGMTALYATIDGSITDNFSYYGQFRFLSSMPKYLYDYEYPCINGTWVNMAYLSYNRDFWGIDLGKVLLNYGGIINEYDDVDCYSELVPFEWSYFNSYQYGLTFRLTPWENHSFEAQFTTSPSMDSFKDMMFAYSLCWRGEMGRYSTVWAINNAKGYVYEGDGEEEDLEEFEGAFEKENTISIGLGNKYEINDRWNIELDAFVHLFGCKFDNFEYSDFELTGAFNATDNLCLKAQVGLKSLKKMSVGAVVEFYPIEKLRLHAAFNYCNADEDFALINKFYYDKPCSASIGVTYTFDFHLGK